MRYLALLAAVLLMVACEINLPQQQAATPIAPGAVTISNTTTNTNTTGDRSDTSPTSPTTPGGGGEGGAVLPLPAYGEQVTRATAAANPTLLQNSCQDTSGESAWQFLDLVIRTLRAQDQRWGYLCKDGSCLTFARDVVAYRASTGNRGIWIVDVIGNHCPGPADPPPAVRWGVLPFETDRPWAATRTAGVFAGVE